MKAKYIESLRRNFDRDFIGNKAQSLVFLRKHKYKIPESFIVTADAFEAYSHDREKHLKAWQTI